MGIEVEAKSLEVAMIKAAGKLGLPQERLSYQIITEKSGFWGFGKSVRINAFARRGEAPTPLSEDCREHVKSFIEGLLEHMGCEPTPKISFGSDEERIIIDIQVNDTLGSKSTTQRVAEATEHLVRKSLSKMVANPVSRIFVDINRIRRDREDELFDVAAELSEKVSRSRKPITLNNYNSYDRRVIHVALDRDKRVYTKSVGSGNKRKLMILPSDADA